MAENKADGRSTRKSLTTAVLLLCVAPTLCLAHLSGRLGVDYYICMTPSPGELEVMVDMHLGEVPTAAMSVRLDKNRNGTLEPEEYQDYAVRSGEVHARDILIICTNGEHGYPMTLGWPIGADSNTTTTAYLANDEDGQKTLRMRWIYSAPWPNDILQRAAEPFELMLKMPGTAGFGCQITTGLPRSPVKILSASVPTSSECPLPADDVPPVDNADLVMTTEGKMRLVLAPGPVNEVSGAPERKLAAINSCVAPTVSEHIETKPVPLRKPARISEVEKIITAKLDALFQPPIGVFSWLIAVFLCFAWGMLHAFTPGHGKVIVSTYLIGSRATYTQAAILGILVTVAHTAVVLVLAVAAVLLKDRFVYPAWLQPLGAVIIMLVGVNQVRMALHGGHGHSHDHHNDHAHNPHKHWGIFSHSHDHHPRGDRLASRDLAAIGLSGGMVPCPAAIVMLLLSWQLAVPVLGLGCLMSFSIGLAGTLMLVGFLSISSVQWVVRWRAKGDDDRRRATALNIIPVIGGIVLILYGAVILLSFR